MIATYDENCRLAQIHAAFLVLIFIGLLAWTGCSDGPNLGDPDSGTDTCSPGQETCPCTADGLCLGDLVCRSNICVSMGSDPTGSDTGVVGTGVNSATDTNTVTTSDAQGNTDTAVDTGGEGTGSGVSTVDSTDSPTDIGSTGDSETSDTGDTQSTGTGDHTDLPSDTASGNATDSAVQTDTGTDTATDMATDTAVATDTVTATDTAVLTVTDTSVATDTDVPTDTDVATDTAVPTDTAVATDTSVATDTVASPTDTTVATDTAVPTDTEEDTEPPPAEVNIMPDTDGWLSSDSTPLHVQGGWYTGVGTGSSITLTNDGSSLCIEGMTEQWIDTTGDTYWGAMLETGFCQIGDDFHTAGDCPLNSQLDEQVAGVAFNISGDFNDNGPLRVVFVTVSGEESYVEISTTGAHVALISESGCWWGDGAPIDVADLKGVRFQVPSYAGGDTYYNACVSNLRILTVDSELNRTAVSIMPSWDGYVTADSNTLGVQGPWYSFGSEDTVISEATVGDETICVNGTAAEVLNGDWGTYYGGILGFNFCTPPSGTPEYELENCPTNTNLNTELKGISFNIAGNLGNMPYNPMDVQMKVTGVDEPAYFEVDTPGHYKIWFDQARYWNETGTPAVDADDIYSVRFRTGSDEYGTTDFDYCISNVKGILVD